MGWIYCYLVVALVAILVAIIDLSCRFKPGNDPHVILVGWPQGFYYFANMLFALGTLFSLEAMGQIDLIALAARDPKRGIVKLSLLAVTSMVALRGSLFSVRASNSGTKVDVGPSEILNVFLRYLERKIDVKRSAHSIAKVQKLVNGTDPKRYFPDILNCLITSSELVPKESLELLTKNAQGIMNISDWKIPRAQGLALGLEIVKEIGFSNLAAVFKALREIDPGALGTDGDTMGTPPLPVPADPLESMDRALDERLRALNGGPAGSLMES